MPRPIVSESLIVIDGAGLDDGAKQVITLLCARLQAEGYTDAGYLEAVLDRESRFPTALPTLPYATAIPHADSPSVHETGVAVAILKHPVPFHAMDAPDQCLLVRAVLLLAVAHASAQVHTLRWVCDILNHREMVERLVSAQSAAAVMTVLSPLLEYQTQDACTDKKGETL